MDLNWAAACWEWDQVRAFVRKLDDSLQAEAWRLAEHVMRELYAEVQARFDNDIEEGVR